MKKIIFFIVAALTAFATPGFATDLGRQMITKAPPAPVAAYRPWYLIGGGALIFSGGSGDIVDRNCGNAVANIPCGTPATFRSDGGWGVFGGVGYRWARWFRTDVRVGYGEGSASSTVTFPGPGGLRLGGSDYSSLNVLAHGFVDIAGLFNPGAFGIFEPYVGAGVGVASIRVTNLHFTVPGFAGDFVGPGGDSTNFGWTAAVGTGVRLTSFGLDNWLFDIAYRYRDFGKAQTNPGPITNAVVGCVGCTVGNGFETRARAHGVDLALRYEF